MLVQTLTAIALATTLNAVPEPNADRVATLVDAVENRVLDNAEGEVPRVALRFDEPLEEPVDVSRRMHVVDLFERSRMTIDPRVPDYKVTVEFVAIRDGYDVNLHVKDARNRHVATYSTAGPCKPMPKP